MDFIAKQLSISKKTLYKHFSNKKELVFQIIKKQISDTEKECNTLFETAENVIHELYLTIEIIKTFFHNINPYFVFDLQKHHPKSWQLVEEHQNKFIHDMILRILQKGIEDNYFREDLNIQILTKLRLEEIKISFNSKIFPPTEYNMEEVQIVMMEHFILGITTLKGHQLAIDYQKQGKSVKNE